MPLSNLVLKTKRAIYFDDFRPVAYAAYPVKAPTLPVPTQLKLLGGEWFEASVSQSLHLGHIDVRWSRGIFCTAKAEGLWDVLPGVTAEDLRHFQARARQFDCRARLSTDELRPVQPCAACFCHWALAGSAAVAPPLPLPAPEAPEEEEEEVVVEFF
jgi:hypothetical protein